MKLKKIILGGLLGITLWFCPVLMVTEVEAITIPREILIEEIETEEVVIEYEEHLVYTTDNVDAREYPTINSAVMETVPQYTELLRVGEEINGWDCVIVNNQELFIKHEYLTTENPLKSIGEYEITAYCACSYCCGKSDGITASGTKATQGRTVACNFLPFGTEVVINGHTYIVEDTGSQKVMGDKVFDVYFDSHEEAKIFGRKTIEVYIKN